MAKVKNESWTVITQDQETNETTRSFAANSEKEAKQTAKEWAKKFNNELVYVEYFRKSDGQQMYLNDDGYDLTGKSWN